MARSRSFQIVPRLSSEGHPVPEVAVGALSRLLENCIASTSILFSKLQKPTVDALAPEADEGRGWLRKATGSCLPSIDPWMSEWGNPPPRKTAVLRSEYIGPVEGTRGIETSQYPEEKKATATP